MLPRLICSHLLTSRLFCATAIDDCCDTQAATFVGAGMPIPYLWECVEGGGGQVGVFNINSL